MGPRRIAREFNLSLRKVRRMAEAGVLNVTPENPLVEMARANIQSGGHLTAVQMAAFVKDPSLLFELGDGFEEAERQMKSLKLESDMTFDISLGPTADFAAEGKPAAIAAIREWMQGIIPKAQPVVHHYLAARILLSQPSEHMHAYVEKRVRKAFLNVRCTKEFEGWFTIAKKGSRTWTVYHRPGFRYDL